MVFSSFKFCAILTFLMIFSACGKEITTLEFEKIPSDTQNRITNIEVHNDSLIFMGGNTWFIGEMGISVDGNSFDADSFSNKIILDFKSLGEEGMITVGIDANIHFRPQEGTWRYERLSEYGILKGVIKTEEGYLAVGGTAQRLGWVYRLDENINLLEIIPLENELTSIAQANETTIITVGYGIILSSEDNGRHWNIIPEEGDYYQSICFPQPNHGFIIGANGALIESTDGGKTWNERASGNSPLGKNNNYRNIQFADESIGIITGDNGKFWRTTDGGDQWFAYDLDVDFDLYDSVFFRNDLYLVGDSGFIARVKF